MEQNLKSLKKPYFWLKIIAFVGLTLIGLFWWGLMFICVVLPFLWGAFWGFD